MEYLHHKFVGPGLACSRKGCGRSFAAKVHTTGEPRHVHTANPSSDCALCVDRAARPAQYRPIRACRELLLDSDGFTAACTVEYGTEHSHHDLTARQAVAAGTATKEA